MGFALSVLYFVTYYLTPRTVFGPIAALHIELILAILVLLVSLPRLLHSSLLKVPETLALIGLTLSVPLSVLVGQHWPGGAFQAFLGFIPNVFAFFLLQLHCNSRKKLKVIVLMMLFVCLFVIAHGAFDLWHGVPVSGPAPGQGMDDLSRSGPTASPYFLRQISDAGDAIYRLEGLGNINDPNDFAQLIVCVIPLIFIFWKPKKLLWNIPVVLAPLCILLFGAYLTHSRGSLVALAALALMTARRRIGTIPSLILAVGLFAGATTLHFTGGREISATAGAGRTDLWGESLQLLTTHPVFGVGFGNLDNYTDSHHTAHNTIAVCAAELGMFGMYFWCLYLFPAFSSALAIASPQKTNTERPIFVEESPFPQTISKIEKIDKAEVNRIGRLLLLSLATFLVAGWFLSRAFVMTLFLLGGMIEVIFEMALQRSIVTSRLPLPRTIVYAGGLAVILVFILYVMVRMANLMH